MHGLQVIVGKGLERAKLCGGHAAVALWCRFAVDNAVGKPPFTLNHQKYVRMSLYFRVEDNKLRNHGEKQAEEFQVIQMAGKFGFSSFPISTCDATMVDFAEPPPSHCSSTIDKSMTRGCVREGQPPAAFSSREWSCQ